MSIPKDSQAWFVLCVIEKYAMEQALTFAPEANIKLPPSAFLCPSLCEELAQAVVSKDFVPGDLSQLIRQVPGLDHWLWLDEHGSGLVDDCIRILREGTEQWGKYQEEVSARGKIQPGRNTALAPSSITPSPLFSPFTSTVQSRTKLCSPR